MVQASSLRSTQLQGRNVHFPLVHNNKTRLESEIMSVARTTEITASSKQSFDDALNNGIKRAAKTLENLTGAWVKDQEVVIEDGKIAAYKVRMMVTFILK
jgi:flavin-binding protein dodecin